MTNASAVNPLKSTVVQDSQRAFTLGHNFWEETLLLSVSIPI